jgi:hypothetical protein
MKRNLLVPLILITFLVFFALLMSVRADNPHFVRGPTGAFDSATGNFCVKFTEAGLGNTPITYTLSVGTELFTFQCFTRSNNTPNGDPNGQSFSDQAVSTTITPHNGRIRGTLCLEPLQGDADCQGHGLVLKLIEAQYEGITFCDATNGVCFDLGDAGGNIVPPIRFP